MSSSSTKKTLILQSSDHEEFMVDEKAATLSQTIKNMVEDGCSSGTIPLPNVEAKLLAKVINYCTKRVNFEEEEEETEKAELEAKIKAFDKEFVDGLEEKILFDLIMAANYLNIAGLMDILCHKVAELIKVKSIPEIRQMLGITNDFSPEEEEQVRQEHLWAHEDFAAAAGPTGLE